MTWANEDPDRLHTPTWYGLKPALMSPPSLVEGGGNGLICRIGCPRYVATTRAATRPFASASRLMERDGGRLVSRCRLKNLRRRLAVPPYR